MSRNRAVLLLLAAALAGPCLAAAVSAPALTTYDAPAGSPANGDFTVQVRTEGGTWRDLFAWSAGNNGGGVPYDGVNHNATPRNQHTWVTFDADFSQRIEVKVTRNAGAFASARIRPTSYGIPFTSAGASLSFFLDRPRKISVEFDGDIQRNLLVFANPHDPSPPRAGDPGVVYFGPGVTNVGTLNLQSNTTYYVAGGAVVKGRIVGSNVSNVTLRGPGLIDVSGIAWFSHGIHLRNCSNVTLRDFVLYNVPGFSCFAESSDRLTYRNVKVMGFRGNSDGIDPENCQDVLIDDVFIRTFDDCISVKSRYSEASRDITVTNSTLWSDAAHAMLIGPEGNGQVTERVLFRNIDVLEIWCSSGPDYFGVMGIMCVDGMTIRQITWDDIRVDDFSSSNLVTIFNRTFTYGRTLGTKVTGITFRNISYHGRNANPSVIDGADAVRNVDGVTFENLRINGQLILGAQAGNFQIGANAFNVRFVGPADTTPPTAPGTPVAALVGAHEVQLSWAAASDAESGVAGYRIHRDGVAIADTDVAIFADRLLLDGASYGYEVSALNGAGLEGPRSARLSVALPTDASPPALVSVSVVGADAVRLVFDEALEAASAETVANYAIDHGIGVLAATLEADPRQVLLTTSILPAGTHRVTVAGVRDRARTPNTAALSASFTVQILRRAINAGGGAVGPFAADQAFSGGSTHVSSAAVGTSGVAGAAPAAVYQSHRFGSAVYDLSGLTAGAGYTLRLHFAETFWTTSGARRFSVDVNGVRALSGLDIVSAAGGANRALVREVATSADGGGRIRVALSTEIDNALICGIEVYEAPAGTANQAPVVTAAAAASPGVLVLP